jgi:hypothetical protein
MARNIPIHFGDIVVEGKLQMLGREAVNAFLKENPSTLVIRQANEAAKKGTPDAVAVVSTLFPSGELRHTSYTEANLVDRDLANDFPHTTTWVVDISPYRQIKFNGKAAVAKLQMLDRKAVEAFLRKNPSTLVIRQASEAAKRSAPNSVAVISALLPSGEMKHANIESGAILANDLVNYFPHATKWTDTLVKEKSASNNSAYNQNINIHQNIRINRNNKNKNKGSAAAGPAMSGVEVEPGNSNNQNNSIVPGMPEPGTNYNQNVNGQPGAAEPGSNNKQNNNGQRYYSNNQNINSQPGAAEPGSTNNRNNTQPGAINNRNNNMEPGVAEPGVAGGKSKKGKGTKRRSHGTKRRGHAKKQMSKKQKKTKAKTKKGKKGKKRN